MFRRIVNLIVRRLRKPPRSSPPASRSAEACPYCRAELVRGPSTFFFYRLVCPKCRRYETKRPRPDIAARVRWAEEHGPAGELFPDRRDALDHLFGQNPRQPERRQP